MRLTRPLKPGLTFRGFRQRLASIDAVPSFAFLVDIAGIVTWGLIRLLGGLIVWPLTMMLSDPEGFDMLGSLSRFSSPVAGAVALGLIFKFRDSSSLRMVVIHVMERLARIQGNLQWQNMVNQFCCGIIALASGWSRGSAIHLVGTTAAISASLNTPIAGVIFSMEVIIIKYTIGGFIPVRLAAVSAALIMQIV
ncbi:MAG: hypothetical protein CMP98_03645 [Gammaproteobacteria bacterium]|nr:hypothetical protein [Gammaproteobacteria bacterium]OUU10957.1 MAG: hypothetical protein CBB94_03760 [Gammaproteobacteria bacterium TMED34]|tara:strand:- start:500 stop:1081 length:582 start_codon:yes stop_codon:yes gene_type:complete